MDDKDIRPGVKIVNIHNGPIAGHDLVIRAVVGDSVVLEMRGPAGTATLDRSLSTIKNHFRFAE